MTRSRQFIQLLIDTFYRHPVSALRKYARFGGWLNYLSMLKGAGAMKRASGRLSPVRSYADGYPIYFLTGKNHLYQTLFCIQSLAKFTSCRFRFILVDDGSFDTRIIKRIELQLPNSELFKKADIEKKLEELLPEHTFPNLNHKRKIYPHIKKLTDIHTLPGEKWKLVLDSDMLFWKEPVAIINWLKDAHMPIYMQDCQNSYGYSKTIMESLCGTNIPDLINVGVIGLNSNTIDWAKLDAWTGSMESAEGSSYYLEQALTAMLINENASLVLPSDEYIVNPAATAVTIPQGILHHYVDLSKQVYFKQAWKTV
ncbi:hypothetical protein SNE25_20250 [Mucilaginibacter sabulilitoris]|uniref:Glycosyl transferase n=1 Tax=Mucilaginibacter sabulilitoris TaxID=1173583 RepID=A0ABZ0THE6_9SPHI|nr:hypothetical protein [Mucilaginibacter sabulilitoris]WPU91653.1 hypothetical protein SNE25_20250 [Mucilaginibacter sabulilitoris]